MSERLKKSVQSKNPVLDLHWGITEDFNLDLLSQCTHLDTLILSCNDNVQNLEWIEPLKNLRVLNLRSCQIQDITPLKHLTRLENLNLGFNFINDFTVLSHLTKLQTLDLHVSRISEIDFLKPLKNLERLYLSFNHITNLEPLKSLSSLVEIDLLSNDIQDISPLEQLGLLEKVQCDIHKLPYPPLWYMYLKYRKGQLADYQQVEELPLVQKIWRLICSHNPDNLALAQQLALGQGWGLADFEMYKDNRPKEEEEDDYDPI